MSYCTIENIISAVSEKKLAQLTDDSEHYVGDPEVDIIYVQNRIDTRSDYIDAHLINKYTLPINNENALNILKDVAVNLVIYDCYARRGRLELTDNITNLMNESIATLKDIQRGAILLDRGDETNKMSPRFYKVEDRTQYFSNSYLDKMP